MKVTGELRSRESLLALLASYYGDNEAQQVVAQLALTHHGGFKTPARVLTILFASRAGSNYFGQLLSGTGNFVEIGESFAPHQLEKIRDRYGLADLHAAAQWMIDNRGTPRAFGFKAGFYVLTAAAELGFLPEVLDRAEFVLLRRRDRVAQAISRVKGKLSGRMHSLQAEGRLLSDDDYDADAIADHLKRVIKVEAQLAEFVTRLGKSAPVIYYEDICAQPEAHVTRVCKQLGLEMPDDYNPAARVRLSVLRDDLSARWAERFRRENADMPGMDGGAHASE